MNSIDIRMGVRYADVEDGSCPARAHLAETAVYVYYRPLPDDGRIEVRLLFTPTMVILNGPPTTEPIHSFGIRCGFLLRK